MRSIWKGTISFGLVNIPISLGIATQRSDPKFRTLDRESLQPIRQQLYSPARDAVVDRDDTVKGYEVAKEQYLPMTDEELDSVAVERRRTIDLLAFVDLGEIDPVFFDRTYYVEPQETAQKPYALLLEALRDTNRAALGKIVMSSKEQLALIRPAGDALVMEVLFYPEDVRSKAEIDDVVRDTTVTDAELAMAKQLVESLAQPFDPEAYENQHKKEVLALIERKLAGEEVPVAAEPAAPAPVPDLMGALKASLEQAKAGGRSGGASRSAAAGNGAPENGGAAGGDEAAAANGGDGAPAAPKRKRAAAKRSG